MDEEYQNQKTQENLNNPKNRFLFLFCHANEVDDSWGCGCDFKTGVFIFSILIGCLVGSDLYYICGDRIFSTMSRAYPKFSLMFGLKTLSDLTSLIGVIYSCIAINKTVMSGTPPTICYYIEVLSFVLCTAFCVYCIFSIFDRDFWWLVSYKVITWAFHEFALLLFCWILFCYMVFTNKQILIHNRQMAQC